MRQSKLKVYFGIVLLMNILWVSQSMAQSSELSTKDDRLNNNNFVVGLDYRTVSVSRTDTANELESLKKVTDIEFFYWYGCEPCLQVEIALTNYLQQNPQYSIKRIPLVAHIDWRPQAYIQPLLQELSPVIATPDNEVIYQACLLDCAVFSSYEKTLSWFKERYSLAELPRVVESNIWQAEKDYQNRADFYAISEVPTIIIRESFRVDANMAGSPERLVKIINHLLQQESSLQ